MTKKKKDDLITALRAADAPALRAYAKQRKDAQPFKRHATEFTKKLRSDAGGAVAWLAAQYVIHYRTEAEQTASDRVSLALWQKEAKKKIAGEHSVLGSALSHLRRLSVESHIDMGIEGATQPAPRTRITDNDIRSVERVFEKARQVAAETPGNMIEGPPLRKRGRPMAGLHALEGELIELLRRAGLSKAATADHVGRLLHPDSTTEATRRAGSIQTALSAR